MKRRDFLKLAASTLLISQIPQGLFAKEPSLVAVSEGPDYAAITRKAMASLGGIQNFVKQGDTVVVKPNIGWTKARICRNDPSCRRKSHCRRVSQGWCKKGKSL